MIVFSFNSVLKDLLNRKELLLVIGIHWEGKTSLKRFDYFVKPDSKLLSIYKGGANETIMSL